MKRDEKKRKEKKRCNLFVFCDLILWLNLYESTMGFKLIKIKYICI